MRSAIRITTWAALTVAITAAVAAQAPVAPPPNAPTARSLFQQARVAAEQLPALLAERELGLIATEEMTPLPNQALKDYASLYAAAHAWPVLSSTPVQRAQTGLRYLIEANAISAYADRGEFHQAMAWLANYEPTGEVGESTGVLCSYVVIQMLAQSQGPNARGAVMQCAAAGAFPFSGAATAMDDPRLAELDRMSMAQGGLQAAGTADDIRPAAMFLYRVHEDFPRMDGATESAVLDLLRGAHADAIAHPGGRAAVDARAGSLLLGLLAELDPARAPEARLEFPAAAGASSPGGLIYRTTPDGKISGAGLGETPDATLTSMAKTDPERALAGASALRDTDLRFAALAGIAEATAEARPALAAQAANEAYGLLDAGVAQAETGYTANLAHAYVLLGDRARGAEVASRALDAADTHAQQAEAQYDLTDPEAVAKLMQQLLLPAETLTYTYAAVASFMPRLAIRHARGCQCQVVKPLMLAKIAHNLAAPAAPEPN